MEINYDLNTPQGMQNACTWTQNLIDHLSDGGAWVVPRALATYTFDKKAKKVWRMGQDSATDRVLTQLGWELC